MIDSAGARLDVAFFEREDGLAQVFDGLLVQADHEAHRAGTPYGCFPV
jgi:hypothetical protein